jgi:hypothetical protein
MTTRDERRKQAILAAAEVLAAARQERDELYLRAGGGRAGAMAVGQAAWPKDAAKAAEIAEGYLTWVAEERQKRTPGSAETPA